MVPSTTDITVDMMAIFRDASSALRAFWVPANSPYHSKVHPPQVPTFRLALNEKMTRSTIGA